MEQKEKSPLPPLFQRRESKSEAMGTTGYLSLKIIAS
jgi:hypothetical protein